MSGPCSQSTWRLARWCRAPGGLVMSFAVVALLTSSARAADTPRVTSFVSGGKEVKVEHFAPRLKGKHPALLLLHGSDGLGKHGDGFRAAARQIAERGYAVLLVHYF